MTSPDADGIAESSPKTTRTLRAWWVVLGVLMVVFSAFPIANLLLGLSTKDYGLWHQVGLAVRRGFDVYPRPETRRLFPFMYPPSAAAMLGVASYLGAVGSLLFLVLVNSASWLASIVLAVDLVKRPGERVSPWLYIVPSLAVIVLIHNVYLLGQPNLLLLALLLGSFACLRRGRQASAGALVATAAAIKAFPIMVLGYFVYRRRWTAAASTVAVLAAWLLAAPLLFRTPAQAVDDLVVWSKGMLFTYDSNGIAQRPFRSYSYKNQSIMALAHRLLRDVPADGESVLSARAKLAGAAGVPAVDPATDLLTFLKPHAGARARAAQELTDPRLNPKTAAGPRWDDALEGAGPDLRAAWRINVANLEFRAVTLATLAAMAAICLFVLAALPPQARLTPDLLAHEFAITTVLATVFSPLSFNYAYVWMLYPATLGLKIALEAPANDPRRRLKRGWIAAVLLIPALAVPMPKLAQAYGNLFIPALILLVGLGLDLRARWKAAEVVSGRLIGPHPARRRQDARAARSGPEAQGMGGSGFQPES